MARKRKRKTDIFDWWVDVITEFNGINLTEHPTLIPSDKFVKLYCLPTTQGIETPPKEKLIFSGKFTKLKLVNVQGVWIFIYTDTNGTLYLDDKKTSSLSILNFGTDEFGVAVTENQYIWIGNLSKLYCVDWINKTITDMTGQGIYGQILLSWKGRLFIAKGRTLYWSKPNPKPDENIWDTSLGAGYITITLSNFNQITALENKQDAIYIYTDKSIITLTGTTVSNDPTYWYLIELSPIDGCVIINGISQTPTGYTYFVGNTGIYRILSTKIEPIHFELGTFSVSKCVFFQYKSLNFIGFLRNNGELYVWSEEKQGWYQLKFDEPVKDIASDGVNLYFVGNSGIFQAFADDIKYMNFELLTGKRGIIDENLDRWKNLRKIEIITFGNQIIRLDDYEPVQIKINLSEEFGQTAIFQQDATRENIVFSNNTGNIMWLYGKIEEGLWYEITYMSPQDGLAKRQSYYQLRVYTDNNVFTKLLAIRVIGWYGAKR